MGAIWGVISLDGKKINEKNGFSMMEDFKSYKVDEISYISKSNAFFGCAKQFITEESLDETIPYYDETSNLLMTADAIIDNRNELIEKLKLTDSIDQISDSKLILEAYKKWGEECQKYLVGDFCFVILKRNKVFVVRDHCGHRPLYYYKDDEKFIFSTTIKAIKNILGEKLKINELWVANYLISGFEVKEKNNYDTVYENIYLVPAANQMIIKNGELDLKMYWNPLEFNKLNLKNYDEGFLKFKEIFEEAVRCRLRTTGNVGILLSGGLDSTSVGALAARELEKRGKKLKAYSSIPCKDYVNDERKNLIPDEREYIEKTLNMYKNIDINYCTGYDKDCLEMVDKVLSCIEVPYLALENAPWLVESSERASTNKCKVVLTGQFGNLSISYGSYISNMKTLFKKKKLLTIYKEINGVSKISGKKKMSILKNTYNILKKEKELYNVGNNIDFKENYLIKECVLKEYSSILDKIPNKTLTFEEMKIARFENLLKNMVGNMDTIIGLNYGLMYRDPTKDKRVVEFCLMLGNDFFVKDGQDRFLIRKSMKDIIPDEIRLNYKKRGVQGCDWTQRILKNKYKNKNELKKYICSNSNNNFINIERMDNELENFNKGLIEDKMALKTIIKQYIVLKFQNENLIQ